MNGWGERQSRKPEKRDSVREPKLRGGIRYDGNE